MGRLHIKAAEHMIQRAPAKDPPSLRTTRFVPTNRSIGRSTSCGVTVGYASVPSKNEFGLQSGECRHWAAFNIYANAKPPC